jgi:uncharacterized membrane protein
MGIFKRLWGWANTIADVVGWIQIISDSGVVVTVCWAFIRNWIQGLDTTELILLLIASFFIVILIITYFIQWRKRKDVKHISDLVYHMNVILKNYATETELSSDNYTKIIEDIKEFLNFDPQDALGAILLPSAHEREKSSDNLIEQMKPMFDGENANKSLNNLLCH